jgi:hypothetical protein
MIFNIIVWIYFNRLFKWLKLIIKNLKSNLTEMHNKYNCNDSIFSIDYKIPYEKSIIE